MTNGACMCQWASKMAGADRRPGEGAERPDWGTPPGSAIAGKLSGARRNSMRARRPRSRGASGPCFGRARAVPAGKVAGCPIAGELSGT